MIEVGEYVRLKNGKIIKFKKFSTSGYSRYRGTDLRDVKTIIDTKGSHFKYDNIIKHSKNIIDLIEEGDYVISQDGIEGKVEFVMLPLKIFVDGEEVLNDDIKSIVTKEKFEAMEYKVKE